MEEQREHSIATIGSHSALDVCEGAKQEGFKSIVIAQRGREKTYLEYYRSRKRNGRDVGVVDEVILTNSFSEMAEAKYVKMLRERNAIFVPNRSFAVYVGYDNIENKFDVPIFGNRRLLRAEERNEEKNQHYLMKKAGMRQPAKIESPGKIGNGLAIVKVPEAKRKYERAFFLVSSIEEYTFKCLELVREGKVTRADLDKATIEEFIVGAQFNFNFFYSPLTEELELLGIDTRKQTNLDGYLHLPADRQMELLKYGQPSRIEVGHVACTLRESLLEQIFEEAEKLVEVCKKEFAPGIIGPFALQGVIAENEKEEFVCFDISFRMPGSPGTRFTPYSSYLFRESISYGKRIAMEIKEAQKTKKMEKITT